METQTVNNDGFDQEANTNVEENYDSATSTEETNLEEQDLGQEGLNEETQEPEWQEGDPLNKHPRFQEVIKANREMKQKMEQMEQQMQQFMSTSQQSQQKPAQNQSSQQEIQRLQDIDDDPEIEEIFSMLPEREFPEFERDEQGNIIGGGYNSISEQYQHFIKNAVKDLSLIREQATEKTSKKEQALQEESKSTVDTIKKSFGTDEQGFQSFAKWAESKYEKGSKLDLQELHSIYVEDVYKRPDTSKVTKANMATSGKIGSRASVGSTEDSNSGISGWDDLELI